jgi:hypothetical protein
MAKKDELLKESVVMFKELHGIFQEVNGSLEKIIEDIESVTGKVDIDQHAEEETDAEPEMSDESDAPENQEIVAEVTEIIPPKNPLEEVEKIKINKDEDQDARFNRMMNNTMKEINVSDSAPADIIKIMPDKKTVPTPPSARTLEQQINQQLKAEQARDLPPEEVKIEQPKVTVVDRMQMKMNRRKSWGSNK